MNVDTAREPWPTPKLPGYIQNFACCNLSPTKTKPEALLPPVLCRDPREA
jgi:hypothetical protein